jgi:hypothetical protein
LDICWVPDFQYLTNASSGEGKKAVILEINKMIFEIDRSHKVNGTVNTVTVVPTLDEIENF